MPRCHEWQSVRFAIKHAIAEHSNISLRSAGSWPSIQTNSYEMLKIFTKAFVDNVSVSDLSDHYRLSDFI